MLLKAHTALLRGCADRTGAMELLCPSALVGGMDWRLPLDMSALLEESFRLPLARKQIDRLDKANSAIARAYASLFPAVIQFNKPQWLRTPLVPELPRSTIVTIAQLEALWELLPPLLGAASPALLYASTHHGYALERLYRACGRANGMEAGEGAVAHAGTVCLRIIRNLDTMHD